MRLKATPPKNTFVASQFKNKIMNKKITGLIAMLTSPFLAVDTMIHGSFDSYNSTSLGGFLNLIYMTGWLLALIFLYRVHADCSKNVKAVFIIQFIFLFLAELWNVWTCIDPKSNHLVFRTLDLFWPISNTFMFITGLTILLAKKVRGWQRYIPLIVGLWLPTGVVTILAFGRSGLSATIVSIYSVVAWSLLGLSIYTSRQGIQYSSLFTQAA